jgi:hypothetical protein
VKDFLRSILVSALFALAACLTLTISGIAQDKPTIMKDWVQVDAFTVNSYKGNYDVWSWIPMISFRVNGPIESGGQLYVEFGYPGAAKWVTFDCPTEQTQKGYWWKVNCGGRDGISEDKGITYAGPVTFNIKMRNELAGTDMNIFSGKAKILKVLSNEYGPKAANHFVYFVDKDWNLPIGYVWVTPNDVYGWKLTNLNVAFWVRGEPYRFDPHVFYQGKEVGKVFLDGTEVGKAGCESDIDSITTHYVKDDYPQKGKWSRVVCRFYNIYGLDDSGQGDSMFGPKFEMRKNPGEYEVKVLWNNKLARSIKFTVKPGGSFDNGIASSNAVGTDRVIVPVTILGEQDGTWDRNAWKTDAFYGNPLTGFTALP